MTNFNNIPSWVIEKRYGRGTLTAGACILAIDAGHVWVERETAKAILVGWQNTELMSCKVGGGEFWVAKSLL